MNAVRHGLLAQLPVLPTLETQANWDDHVTGVFDALQPMGYLEVSLTERIALLLWRLSRAARWERDESAIAIEEAQRPAKELAMELSVQKSAEHRDSSRNGVQDGLAIVNRLLKPNASGKVRPEEVFWLLNQAEEATGLTLEDEDDGYERESSTTTLRMLKKR